MGRQTAEARAAIPHRSGAAGNSGFAVVLASSRARRPKPKEVEIEVAATGLNFMDLMLAMGMLPREATADGSAGKLLGLECAGRVVAVGDDGFGVRRRRRGRCGQGLRSLATHLTVDERFVAHKPRHLSLEQAATIPIAFLTAFYSLHTLGKLQRGERVLIHSGTGGVGLAAVQLALKAGAIVFATAGSAREAGTAHGARRAACDGLAQSRLRRRGAGVDRRRGRRCRAELAFGRGDRQKPLDSAAFRTVHRNRQDRHLQEPQDRNAAAAQEHLRVCRGFARRARERPDLARSMLRDLLERLDSKSLRPLPHRVFPVARARGRISLHGAGESMSASWSSR